MIFNADVPVVLLSLFLNLNKSLYLYLRFDPATNKNKRKVKRGGSKEAGSMPTKCYFVKEKIIRVACLSVV
jgi:hypothetical protein